MAAVGKPDVTLEDAIRKTQDVGFRLNFRGATVAGDIYELKDDLARVRKEVEKTRSQIQSIHWFVGIFTVALLLSVSVMLTDYFRYLTDAYRDYKKIIIDQEIRQGDARSLRDVRTLTPLKSTWRISAGIKNNPQA